MVNSESEETATASEIKELITPGQRPAPPQDDLLSETLPLVTSNIGEDPLLILSDPNQSQPSASNESQGFWYTVTGRGKSKRVSTTDDESENIISLQVGTFVNSLLNRTGTEKKKTQDIVVYLCF